MKIFWQLKAYFWSRGGLTLKTIVATRFLSFSTRSNCFALNHCGYFLDPPVVVSPPHFYQGNKSLVEAVHGLHPSKSADETFVDIEPVSKEMNERRRIVFDQLLFRFLFNLMSKVFP